jgi:exonuclease SbcC
MRPVRLVTEGFTAFRDAIDVDFTNADFFALVGPTGSGKSSVLDAICFALYGSVPRYEDDRLVAPSITQGANEARVSLTFEIDGDNYVATRVVRRTARGGASTREARLEKGDVVLAGDAREMNAVVGDLIGLPFHHFTRCVVLPQGEFAQFLHDKPSERQDLLVKLLDLGVYERMRQRASSLAAEKQNEIALDEERLKHYDDCTPGAQTAAKAAVAAVKALRTRLKNAEPQVVALESEAASATVAADAAKRVIALLEQVKVPKRVRTLNLEREGAIQSHEEAVKDRESAELAVEARAKEMDALADPSSLQQLLDAHLQLSELREELKRLDDADAATRLTTAEAALDEATHLARHAQAAYDAAVEDTAATVLAAALVIGELCPVCEQVVSRKPKVRPGEKNKAKKALDAARKVEDKARLARDDTKEQVASARGQRKTVAGQIAEFERKVAKSPEPKALAQELAAAKAARKKHDDAQKAFQGSVRIERAAADKVKAFDTQLTDARRECDAQRDPLVGSGLDVPGLSGDLLASWDALVAWSATEIPNRKAHQEAQASIARQRLAAAHERVVELCEVASDAGIAVPVRPAPSIVTLREAAAAGERDAAAEARRINEGIKEAAKLTTRIADARTEIDVARELARLLRSDHFEQWLVNEALERLVVGASTTLEQLSNGQYALGVDDRNEFEVIDHRNADERRPAKTLSGGETFQASLALALALADEVGATAAQGAAKLDSIFLDEGFGTLDPDCLDMVAATLETLGADDRVVGIVTHVRDLAERVPVRFEVTKGPRTSTVTRVDA